MSFNEPRRDERPASRGAMALGLLLVVGGAVLLYMQLTGFDLGIDFGRVGWPVFIIAPGVVILAIGLLMREDAGVGVAIFGAIVTTVGLLLAYQSFTDHYASWAYAWALVAPGSVGAAMLLWGLAHRRAATVRDGLGALAVGVVIFLVGFAFFEGMLRIGDGRGVAAWADQVLPIALIVAGVLIIASRLWPRRRGEEPRSL